MCQSQCLGCGLGGLVVCMHLLILGFFELIMCGKRDNFWVHEFHCHCVNYEVRPEGFLGICSLEILKVVDV